MKPEELTQDPYNNFRYIKNYPSKDKPKETNDLTYPGNLCTCIYFPSYCSQINRIALSILSNVFLIIGLIIFISLNISMGFFDISQIIYFIAFAIFYLVCHFAANPVKNYLDNIISKDNLISCLKDIYTSPPLLIMLVNNYSTNCAKDPHKSVTYIEEKHFHYYSYRDVSGLLNLNEIANNKAIRVEIDYQFECADLISYSDYLNVKMEMYLRNINNDKKISYVDVKLIRDINKKLMILNCGQSDSIFFKKFTYYIFVMLGLAFIYNIIFFCCNKKHNIKIKKIYSTRFDIGNSDNDSNSKKSIPCVIVDDKRKIMFNLQEISGVFPKYKKEEPSEEELNRAQQYENEIGYHSNNLVNHTVNFPSLTSMNELIKKIIMGRFYKSQLYPNEKPYESNNLISEKSSNDETLTLSNKYNSSKDDK